MLGSEFPPFDDPEHGPDPEFSEGGREDQYDDAGEPEFSFDPGATSDTPEDVNPIIVPDIDGMADARMTAPDDFGEEAVQPVAPATFEEIIGPFQREHATDANGNPLAEFDYDLHFGLIPQAFPSEAEAAEVAGEFAATSAAALDRWKDFDHAGRVILEAHTTDGYVGIVLEQDSVQIATPPSARDESMIAVARYRQDGSSGCFQSKMYRRPRLTDDASRRATYFTENQPVGSPEVRSLKGLLERARPYAPTLSDVYGSVTDCLDMPPTVDRAARSAESATVFSKNVASVLAGKGHDPANGPWEYETTDERGVHMQVQIYQTYRDIRGEEGPRVVISLDRPIRSTEQEQSAWGSGTFHETIVCSVYKGLFVGELSSYTIDPEGLPSSPEPRRPAILGVDECRTLHHFIHEPHLSSQELHGR